MLESNPLMFWHEMLKNASKQPDARILNPARRFKFKVVTHAVIILVYVNDLVVLSPDLSGVK